MMLAWIKLRLFLRGAKDIRAIGIDFDYIPLGKCGLVRVYFGLSYRVFIDFAVASGSKAKHLAAELNK
jgi:hypothetical protein